MRINLAKLALVIAAIIAAFLAVGTGIVTVLGTVALGWVVFKVLGNDQPWMDDLMKGTWNWSRRSLKKASQSAGRALRPATAPFRVIIWAQFWAWLTR